MFDLIYFWEIRFFKGKWRIRLLISAHRKAYFQVLEPIPQEGRQRSMQKGEFVNSPIRMCHKKRK